MGTPHTPASRHTLLPPIFYQSRTWAPPSILPSPQRLLTRTRQNRFLPSRKPSRNSLPRCRPSNPNIPTSIARCLHRRKCMHRHTNLRCNTPHLNPHRVREPRSHVATVGDARFVALASINLRMAAAPTVSASRKSASSRLSALRPRLSFLHTPSGAVRTLHRTRSSMAHTVSRCQQVVGKSLIHLSSRNSQASQCRKDRNVRPKSHTRQPCRRPTRPSSLSNSHLVLQTLLTTKMPQSLLMALCL